MILRRWGASILVEWKKQWRVMVVGQGGNSMRGGRRQRVLVVQQHDEHVRDAALVGGRARDARARARHRAPPAVRPRRLRARRTRRRRRLAAGVAPLCRPNNGFTHRLHKHFVRTFIDI